MNKVILMGNLTRDPEIRYSQSSEPVAVAKFTLAVSRKFKRDNEPDTDFINCVTFGKQAEFAERFLKKGMKIAVSGRLKISTVEDANGQRRWFTDVILEEIDFAESRGAYEQRMANSPPDYGSDAGGYGGGSGGYSNSKPQAAPKPASYEPEGFAAITESIDDDDLPF